MNRTKLPPLVNILTISLCAIISGCDDFCTIEEYGKAKQSWFEAFLDMPNLSPMLSAVTGMWRISYIGNWMSALTKIV
jgi:hypothetical protein